MKEQWISGMISEILQKIKRHRNGSIVLSVAVLLLGEN